jgi:gamma-glutamyltranspeptidase
MKIDDGSWSLSAAEAKRTRQRPEASARAAWSARRTRSRVHRAPIMQQGGNAFDAAIAWRRRKACCCR